MVGEWQTKCVKKPNQPTENELKEICTHLGFPNVTHVQHRLLDPEVESEMESEYRSNPIKVVSTDMFSTLELNEKFNLTSIQPSRKVKKIQQWNATDNANCYQLEIKCKT